ncbi:MAG: cell division protein FtsQ [Cyclobacteriaceae bacterium]
MWKGKLVKLIVWGVLSFVMLVSIAFSGKRHGDREINDLIINIDNQYQNHFIDAEDVRGLINADDENYLLATELGTLDLKLLESRILANKFVADAEAYLDHRGNLIVSVQQSRPIARIFDPVGQDFYIDTDGDILPVSERYTARVMLIELENKNEFLNGNLNNNENGAKLFELIQTIDQDEFWKAQIAQIYVKKNHEVQLIPQVTKQVVEFGLPEQIDQKLRKLMVFYKEILPIKGWNTYTTVSLKFENQIVCE